jgi:hypothetical protein
LAKIRVESSLAEKTKQGRFRARQVFKTGQKKYILLQIFLAFFTLSPRKTSCYFPPASKMITEAISRLSNIRNTTGRQTSLRNPIRTRSMTNGYGHDKKKPHSWPGAPAEVDFMNEGRRFCHFF